MILGNATAELRQLTDLLGYPVTNTLMGLGSTPSSDPKFLGMLSMHGTYEANMTMQHCDVLLAVGARFDDRVIGNPRHFAQVERKIIHVDIDPSSISKRVKVDIPIVGDVKDVLQELITQIRASQERAAAEDLNAWWRQIKDWRSRDCLAYKRSDTLIKPQTVVEKLWELTRGTDAYITSDGGQHQQYADACGDKKAEFGGHGAVKGQRGWSHYFREDTVMTTSGLPGFLDLIFSLGLPALRQVGFRQNEQHGAYLGQQLLFPVQKRVHAGAPVGFCTLIKCSTIVQ